SIDAVALARSVAASKKALHAGRSRLHLRPPQGVCVMIRRLMIMLIATGLVLGGVFAFQAFKAKMIEHAMAALANPPQTVSTTVAQVQEWQPQIEAIGSVRAVNGANLSSQVSGIVTAIHFESGKDVTQGILLLELQAADDIARLESLKATAELSRIT